MRDKVLLAWATLAAMGIILQPNPPKPIEAQTEVPAFGPGKSPDATLLQEQVNNLANRLDLAEKSVAMLDRQIRESPLARQVEELKSQVAMLTAKQAELIIKQQQLPSQPTQQPQPMDPSIGLVKPDTPQQQPNKQAVPVMYCQQGSWASGSCSSGARRVGIFGRRRLNYKEL